MKTVVSVFRELQTQPLDRVNRDIPYEVNPSYHFYATPLIRISQVVFDWENQSIFVGMDGVLGEIYTLRLSQGDVGLVMEEHVYVKDGITSFSIGVSLLEGRTYTFGLYDYFNTQHAIFTWRQSFDWDSRHMFFQEFIDLPPPPLARTNDALNHPITFLTLLALIIAFMFFHKKWRTFA